MDQSDTRNVGVGDFARGDERRLVFGDKGPIVAEVRKHVIGNGFAEAKEGGMSDVFDEELVSTLQNYKAFYGLPGSAVIDEHVLRLIRTPRCGAGRRTAT